MTSFPEAEGVAFDWAHRVGAVERRRRPRGGCCQRLVWPVEAAVDDGSARPEAGVERDWERWVEARRVEAA